MPPGPTIETSRCCDSACRTVAAARSRPKGADQGCGRAEAQGRRGGAGVSEAADFAGEAVAEGLLADDVPAGAAQELAQVGFVDRDGWPSALEELGLRDEAAGFLHERGQDRVGAVTERDEGGATPEHLARCVQPKFSEGDL